MNQSQIQIFLPVAAKNAAPSYNGSQHSNPPASAQEKEINQPVLDRTRTRYDHNKGGAPEGIQFFSF